MASYDASREKRWLDFGRSLKNLRTNNDLSQNDLVARVNKYAGHDALSQSYYARLEQGYHLPKPELLSWMAKSLDVGVDDLLATVHKFSSSGELFTIAETPELVIKFAVPPDLAYRLNERDVLTVKNTIKTLLGLL